MKHKDVMARNMQDYLNTEYDYSISDSYCLIYTQSNINSSEEHS